MDDVFLQFREKFTDEAHSLIAKLEKSLLQLESNSNDKEAIEEVFRFAHTLKGGSAMYGFTKISEYTHQLESLFDCIRNHIIGVNSEIIDLTLESADHLKNLLDDFDFNNLSNQLKHGLLLGKISQLVESKSISTTPQVSGNKNKKVYTYYIYFIPNDNLILRCIKIINIFRDLAEIGTFKLFQHSENLSNTYSHGFENAWAIILTTSEPVSVIEDIFMFIEDDYKLFCLGENDLLNEITAESVPPKNNLNLNELTQLSQDELEAVFKPKNTQPKAPAPNIKSEDSPSPKNSSRQITVDLEKLDTLMYLVSELVTGNAQLKLGFQKKDLIQLERAAEKIDKLTKQFRENAFNLRLVPIEANAVSFQRLVRDLSHSLNKEAKFEIDGGETELDKSIMDKLMEPLVHLLRNSLDHGIEAPNIRSAKGKNPCGLVKIAAFHRGNYIYIKIQDDGAGIDTEKIKAKAMELGLIENTDIISQTEVYDLIFLPGLSTAENLSEISGRGMGMNVVKRKIQELRGEITVESTLGEGTSFIIKLQQTISIVDTLLTQCGNSMFAIPLSEVENCQLPLDKTVLNKQNKQLDYKGNLIPYINLRYEFECFAKEKRRQKIVVINRLNHRFAIIVDEIIGEHQAVVKPLGKVFSDIDFVYGASILGNGAIALLLDTQKLIQN